MSRQKELNADPKAIQQKELVENENKELPHKLFLTTRETIKQINAFANSMSKDLQFSKAQISNIIQSGGYLGSWLNKSWFLVK